jgi:hypothetical protein
MSTQPNETNPRGHVWRLDTDGLPDFLDNDPHTSRSCARCETFQCVLCDPDFLTEDCPEFGNELPGLEF